MSADEQTQNERDLFAQAFISGHKELNELTLTWTGYEQILAAAATNARREELEHVIYILHHTDGCMAKTAFHNQPAGIGREAYIEPFEFLCDCGGLEMREILQKRLAALDSHPEEASNE